jgi:hypothetical protein
MKTCTNCHNCKDLSEFGPCRGTKDGLKTQCRGCLSEKSRQWRQENKDRARSSWKRWAERHPEKEKIRVRRYLARKRGIPAHLFESIEAAREGKCQLCGCLSEEGKVHCLDHDHATGEFRGVICRRCNTVLGLVKDDASILTRAVDYLSSSPGLIKVN